MDNMELKNRCQRAAERIVDILIEEELLPFICAKLPKIRNEIARILKEDSAC